MNIFFHEIKAYRNSTLVWIVSLMAMVVLFISFYPSISKDIDQFNRLLEGFPEPIRQAFGLQLVSMGTLLGFYSYVMLYFTLCGAVQAMNIGLSILSKEVREKTADFLLTKPVSRTKVLTFKLLAAVVLLVVTNIAFIVTASLMAIQIKTDDYSTTIFYLISITVFFVQLIFLALGLLISVLFPRIKSVLTVSLGTIFSFFFIGMLVATDGDGGKRYLSPFKYFDTAYIIEHSSYETPYLFTGLAIVIVSMIASYILYTRRDIHAV